MLDYKDMNKNQTDMSGGCELSVQICTHSYSYIILQALFKKDFAHVKHFPKFLTTIKKV